MRRPPRPRTLPDPAADVRELISLDDAMEEMGFGPNGGLVYCMEYLVLHNSDWLEEQLEGWICVRTRLLF